MHLTAIDAVVFDLDGTLVDSHGVLWDAYAAFLDRHGKRPTRAEFASLNGPSLSEIVDCLAERHGLDDRADLLAEYRLLLDDAYAEAPAMPHADRLLRDLHGRLPLGLVTSAPRQLAAALLERHRWAQLFAVVITGDDGPAKPDPALYRLAADRLGVASGNIAVIEDGVHGVHAAVGAGQTVIGFGSDELLGAGASACVASLDELFGRFA